VTTRALGITVIAAGALVGLGSALADPLGIGSETGFGWKQIVGVVVGAAAIVVGAFLTARRGRRRGAAERPA
jgi:hypothetical protein